VTSDDVVGMAAGEGRVRATYGFGSADADAARSAAEAFAVGQSVGTWVPLPGLTPELMARHGAHVIDVRASDGGTEVAIDFPIVNFERGGFAMLLTTVVGNDPSTGISATLVDLELPSAYARTLGGPRLGVAGWRARLGVADRPLLLNPMKPCTGLRPDATAGMAAEVARGGIDLVKDDEVLADTSFSGIAERCRAVAQALDEVADRTGHRTHYLVSITDRPDRMVEHARAAIDAGTDGVMVAGLLTGLDALQMVVEEADGAVPVVAHTAGLEIYGAGDGLDIAPAVLVGRLLRAAGADAVLIGSPWARRPTPLPEWRRFAGWLLDGWSGFAPAFPVVGGGVVTEQLGEIVRILGGDVIITSGGAINGHPAGAEAGAREMMAALEAAAREASHSGSAAIA
jgi:2,3-diketo-5-methylthiopentyl-1-phosphate enolase